MSNKFPPVLECNSRARRSRCLASVQGGPGRSHPALARPVLPPLPFLLVEPCGVGGLRRQSSLCSRIFRALAAHPARGRLPLQIVIRPGSASRSTSLASWACSSTTFVNCQSGQCEFSCETHFPCHIVITRNTAWQAQRISSLESFCYTLNSSKSILDNSGIIYYCEKGPGVVIRFA